MSVRTFTKRRTRIPRIFLFVLFAFSYRDTIHIIMQTFGFVLCRPSRDQKHFNSWLSFLNFLRRRSTDDVDLFPVYHKVVFAALRANFKEIRSSTPALPGTNTDPFIILSIARYFIFFFVLNLDMNIKKYSVNWKRNVNYLR